ncbi:hypothetical protein GCM10020254_23530 [Streptomyces goshikiensis]
MTAPEKIPNAGKKAKDLNEVIRYTLWSVFKLKDVLPQDRAGFADEVQGAVRPAGRQGHHRPRHL